MRRKGSTPKLYTGGNVGPGMIPTEYLPVGKPNPVEHRAEGSIEPTRPIDGSYAVTTPRRSGQEQEKDDAAGHLDFGFREEAADGFYEDAPDLAAHDRAVREARGEGGGGGTTAAEAATRRIEHVTGVGDVEVYDDTQPNLRDAADAENDGAGVAGMTIEM